MKKTFAVTGMTCAACQAAVTRAVEKLDGVTEVNVNVLTGTMTLDLDPAIQKEAAVMEAVEKVGYGISLVGGSEGSKKADPRAERQKLVQEREREESLMTRRLIASAI
ncbi:MAG TPA: heavy metal-associated domain-containing protein, partial [Clostridia bacterium]|nr:heavy metal-associated domain-containing protein [Clostridia bacterium]